MKHLKNLSKRGLALLIVLVMCLGMMQITAFAEEGGEPQEEAVIETVAPSEAPAEIPEEDPVETPVETPEMPAIQASETFYDQGVTVEISAPEGAFPAGTTVSIVPVPEIPMAFDITFTGAEGEELQPADGLSVDVNFSVPNRVAEMGFAGAVLEIVHITDEENWEGETVSSQEVTADDGDTVEITAGAESFSVYAARFAAPRAGGDSYGTNGAAVLAAMKNLRSDNTILTRSAYESFYPETNTYNVCWGWNAEDGYGTVELDEENPEAVDVVWTTYYDSHFLGKPKGYKWITKYSSNRDVAWADVDVIEVEGKQALKVTIHRGEGSGRAVIEIGFTVTEMNVLAGIAWDYQTFSDTNGYLYYVVDNEGEEVLPPNPEDPKAPGTNPGWERYYHEVYMPVGEKIERIDVSPTVGNAYVSYYIPPYGYNGPRTQNSEIATGSLNMANQNHKLTITAKSAGVTYVSYDVTYDGWVGRTEYYFQRHYVYKVTVYDPATVEIPVGTPRDIGFPEIPDDGLAASIAYPGDVMNPLLGNSGGKHRPGCRLTNKGVRAKILEQI